MLILALYIFFNVSVVHIFIETMTYQRHFLELTGMKTYIKSFYYMRISSELNFFFLIYSFTIIPPNELRTYLKV